MQSSFSLAQGRLEPASVYDPVAQQDIVYAHRNNTVATFGLHSVELIHVLVQERMAAACGLPLRHFEPPTELHYFPGEQIANHYDFVDPKSTPDYAGEIARNGQRLITFILYLNEDYEGGETAFPTLGFSHKGHTGEGIYFVNALPDMSAGPAHAACGLPDDPRRKVDRHAVHPQPSDALKRYRGHDFQGWRPTKSFRLRRPLFL